MSSEKKLNEFKQSDFWKQVVKDATARVSKSRAWTQFDDPNSYYDSGAKESTRSVLIEQSLNDLFDVYDMEIDFITAEDDVDFDFELRKLKKLQDKIKADSTKYNTWKTEVLK